MSEHKYSIAEIDRMRSAVWQLTVVNLHVYGPGELDRQVEERLRTYMLNGTTREELEQEVQRRREERIAARRLAGLKDE